MHQEVFERRWDFSQKRIQDMIDILQENVMHLVSIEIADQAKDTQQSTDLIVRVNGGDVAVRTRDRGTRFRDFTVRSRSYYGHKTELDKLREGFAKWYLYAWEIADGYDWILVDMDRVRDSGLLDVERREIRNKDDGGRTRFIAIGIDELRRADCIVNESITQQPQFGLVQ